MWVSEQRFVLRMVHLNGGAGYGPLFLRNLISGKWEGELGLGQWKQREGEGSTIIILIEK